MKGYILYKIFYGDLLIYLGRTKQDLQQRLRGHFFAKPMHRIIDLGDNTHVEYTECATEADMYLYEIYYINKYHPPLNIDDRARDELTVNLPELMWRPFELRLREKWMSQLAAEIKSIRSRGNYGPMLRLKERLQEVQQ